MSAPKMDPIETAHPEEVEKLQLKRLRWTLSVAKKSPMYRSKLNSFKQKSIRKPEDVLSLPFTTKQDLRQAYPYGVVPVDLERIVFFFHSSGTTGKPISVFLTNADIARTTRFQIRGFLAAGMDSNDRVQLIVAPAMGLLFEIPLHRLGAMTILSGPGNTMAQAQLIRDLDVSCVFGVPSYLLHLVEKLDGKTSVKKVVTLGENLTESMRRRLERMWDVEVYNDYGSTELCAGFLECGEHCGCHVFSDNFLVETVDPKTGEPTDDKGELVFTTLYREGSPLVRYRTGDIVRVERDRCGCGRTSPRLFFEGRIGDMVKIKGSAVYPTTLKDAMFSIEPVSNFQFVVSREGSLDVLLVRVEANTPSEALRAEIEERVKAACNVTPRVEFVPAGSLRGERKTRYFVDLRQDA